MRNITLSIQYDGTNYKGWQRLGDSDKTIQGKLENVLTKMTNEEIEIIGSGRTDAGVHALNQVANFKTNSAITLKEILEYTAHYLPEDIVVKSAVEASENFHSRYNAKRKIYLYRICNNLQHNVFERKYVYHITEPLDRTAMKEAASILVGQHDFRSFTSLKSKKKSTVREIYSIDIIDNKDEMQIIYDGNGFLHNMVRIITGTLIEIGKDKLKVSELRNILNSKDRSCAGYTAPPKGLFLKDVLY
ncbi:MAG: tRNA pseudouridine(38-40) synthase TruA [Bacillota bacterium]|nr:tRNA pseudouridine(38-40) synthase TruA [Bacillota bacterium]